jgi:hypothetical protein
MLWSFRPASCGGPVRLLTQSYSETIPSEAYLCLITPVFKEGDPYDTG